MRVVALFSISVFIVLMSCTDSQNDVEFQHLDGDWQFSKVGDTLWMPGNIPGTVQADLLSLGKIPDPFKLNNEDSIQWVSEKNWQYKRSFSVSQEILKKKKHFLKFEGLDTYASVYLNDSVILKANNAFRSWEIDLSDVLKAENELRIQFQSPDSIEKAEAAKLDYELPEAPRVFTRKPQFQYGWDWGPTIKTIGIWKNVTLTSFDIARCTDVFLETKSITDSLAEIVARLTIETLDDNKITVEITNRNTNESLLSSFEISPNQSQYEIPFMIKNPKLWWTHNLGDPFLYDIDIELKLGSKKIERYTKKLGIRTIELITEKDSIGESFYFKLNGKPVYMKGANYIPQKIMHPEIVQEKYVKLIDDVVSANMNMLRVWGGGIYEDNFFYQLCDAKGVLVWQDFMFACAMYPGDPNFIENAKQEAVENVKRLRQHPSIALWCGNNENSEGWHRWGWQNGKTEAQKQEIWSGYYALFNHILPRVVDSLNPAVDYWESSPKFGRGDPRYQFEGDAHDWWVWHDGYPFEHFEEAVPRFMSEFGFQSFPSYETIQYFTEQDSIDISHPAFATHQKHKRGFQLIRDYMGRDFPVPENDEDYVYVSQLVQAYGITKGIHAHRRAKPYNMGTLYWQLNDCWPAVSWSSIDGLGNWKALHFKAKKSFENLLISTEAKNDSVSIYIVNDSFSEVKNSLEFELLDFSGKSICKESTVFTSKPDSSLEAAVFSTTNCAFNSSASVLRIKFGDAEYYHYFVKPKDLELQPSAVKTQINKTKTGFSASLSSETLQKDVFLSTEDQGMFDDNFFDLLPNTPKTVHFKTDSKTTPRISIKTLNQLRAN